ncbi:MAG: acetyl-CoA carboxylase, carboxyltransferase subunit beta [Actinophytocola sp.]|uniref:acetyl-CoA carboxylase, carboxyltransferase subunit beta n=1 Tax=Actinophytocola sp. TaxID=1872138 RepID=UPI001324C82C|nr:acetyl-CoA carboxylase, carboxyltransferase subunit beta [Actinophytocola sp.]MPZ85025.1 acetyl-CoA carboxylase, carboxyltransferase subunit beta [Actinophytocola sp.]
MTAAANAAGTATSAEPVEWVSCRQCRSLVYGKRLSRSLRVCPDCGYHGRVSARQRLDQLLDPGTVTLLDLPVHSADPLEFTDSKPYPARLADARRKTGLAEAVLCASGSIEGNPLVVAVMDFDFMGGSLGGAVGELITLAGETALERGVPLLIATASGGARMQEGAVALMQMAKTSAMLGRLDEAGLLTITLVTDPTFGGVAASFATLSDVIIAEPGARLGFAGRRVIEQTIKQTLPPDFQTAEFLLDNGLIDMIRPRQELRPTLARLLSMGTPVPRDHAVPAGEPGEPGAGVAAGAAAGGATGGEPWQVVKRARDLNRPTTADYFGLLLDDFEELRGDRLGADCPAIVGGLGRLAGIPVMVMGHQKGHTAAQLAARNFGMPTPAGYRKSARLMRLAAKLGIPIISLIDTPGAYPGKEAEQHGQAIAIAENIRLMASLPVPVVSVVTGEGGSGGALALGVANHVLICANAVYSVISPEGCAAILWNDPAAAPRAAEALRVTSAELLPLGIVDRIVPEPDGGTQADDVTAGQYLRAALLDSLRALLPLEETRLIADRRARFRAFGAGH